jgi:cytochrome b6-f complex iron-sulfur subunit
MADQEQKSSAGKREEIIAKLKADGVWKSPLNRRKFITTAAAGWAIFAAAFAGLGSILAAFMAPRLDFTKAQKFRAGVPDEYATDSVSERYKSSEKVWLCRTTDKIVAVSTVCTHLGCTPNWSENEKKFKCPCHGSGFYGPRPGVEVGVNFEGPAPTPLPRYKITLADDGQIVVDKGQMFFKEKGEWGNPESFVPV